MIENPVLKGAMPLRQLLQQRELLVSAIHDCHIACMTLSLDTKLHSDHVLHRVVFYS